MRPGQFASVRAFAAALAERTDRLDVLVNHGAAYLYGEDLGDVADVGIVNMISS